MNLVPIRKSIVPGIVLPLIAALAGCGGYSGSSGPIDRPTCSDTE
jgi:hypothetical protein